MRMKMGMLAFTVSLIASMLIPAASSAAYEWGSTARWPWSGSWWPMLEGNYANLYDAGGAMSKYDQYIRATTGTAGTAQAWERANHFTANQSEKWFGHCHAWSAAAILNPEPPNGVTKGGVAFSSDDLKGLESEIYFDPKFNWLSGTRSETTNVNDAAYKDIAPAWMDWLLSYYVKQYRYPFIMDVSADAEVWNFPVFAYTRNTTAKADGSTDVATTVWFSNPESRRGTGYISKNYTYNLRAGTAGTWTGSSVTTHPDFAWVPTGHNAMPHVKDTVVSQLVGNAIP